MEGSVISNGADTWEQIKGDNGSMLYSLRAARTDWEDAKKRVASGNF